MYHQLANPLPLPRRLAPSSCPGTNERASQSQYLGQGQKVLRSPASRQPRADPRAHRAAQLHFHFASTAACIRKLELRGRYLLSASSARDDRRPIVVPILQPLLTFQGLETFLSLVPPRNYPDYPGERGREGARTENASKPRGRVLDDDRSRRLEQARSPNLRRLRKQDRPARSDREKVSFAICKRGRPRLFVNGE